MASLFDNVFKPIFSQIGKTNHPEAVFEVTNTNSGSRGVFHNQTTAKNFAKLNSGLYEVVIYIAGTRQVIYQKQY